MGSARQSLALADHKNMPLVRTTAVAKYKNGMKRKLEAAAKELQDKVLEKKASILIKQEARASKEAITAPQPEDG